MISKRQLANTAPYRFDSNSDNFVTFLILKRKNFSSSHTVRKYGNVANFSALDFEKTKSPICPCQIISLAVLTTCICRKVEWVKPRVCQSQRTCALLLYRWKAKKTLVFNVSEYFSCFSFAFPHLNIYWKGVTWKIDKPDFWMPQFKRNC